MGIFDFFKRGASDDSHVPGEGDREEYLEYLDEQIQAIVSGAFADLDDAEESLVDQFIEDPDSPLTRDEVIGALHKAWAARLDEQATWSDEGDYPRIAAAFKTLEESGIVARMNFTCCQTCGHAEIRDERDEDSRGYTFWHQQDTEGLPDGELYLAYGGFHYSDQLDPALVERAESGDDDAKSDAICRTEELIGEEIVTALRQAGLAVVWDGSSESRILVSPVDWRKKLPVG